jgi:hypothetical protein
MGAEEVTSVEGATYFGPYVAVHKSTGGSKWMVTHVPTGFGMANHRTKKGAFKLARAIRDTAKAELAAVTSPKQKKAVGALGNKVHDAYWAAGIQPPFEKKYNPRWRQEGGRRGSRRKAPKGLAALQDRARERGIEIGMKQGGGYFLYFHSSGNSRTVRTLSEIRKILDRKRNPSGSDKASFIAKIERAQGRAMSAAQRRQFDTAWKEAKAFHGSSPVNLVVGQADGMPEGTVLAGAGKLLNLDYEVTQQNSSRKGAWTHEGGDHGRKRRTPPVHVAWKPGDRRHSPVFVAPKGSRMFFKPSHGIMG